MKRLLLITLAVFLVGGAVLYMTWDNLRTAIPGVAYRSAQLSAAELGEVVKKKGIRTVVNLRPIREGAEWYEEEKAAAEALGVTHHVVGLSQAMPRVDTFRDLRDILTDIETPVLFQCTSGVDRSGVATAMFMLLRGEWNLDEVEQQVGWRYGAISAKSTGKLLLAEYRDWLSDNGLEHAPDVFNRWLDRDYVDPSGNFYFYIHPIREQPWGRPWGLYEEGFEFRVSRSESPVLHMDGWAFDTDNEAPLAAIGFSLGGDSWHDARYGLHFPWLAEDFGTDRYVDTGWSVEIPLNNASDGCHDLFITFERLDGERWQSPPAARICISP